MCARISKAIREKVIEQWLQVISSDQYGKNNDIGAGTVSTVVRKVKNFMTLNLSYKER